MKDEKRISVSLTYAEWQSVKDALYLSITNKQDLIVTLIDTEGAASSREYLVKSIGNEVSRMQSAKAEIERAMFR